MWTAGESRRRFVELLCSKAQARREGARADRRARRIRARHGRDSSRLRRRRRRAFRVLSPGWWNLRRFNHRTHRKLLIVDGAVGYTFGHGIADQWLGDGEDKDHWRDTGVRLEGPVGARAAIGVHGELDRGDALRAGRRGLLSRASSAGRCRRTRRQQRVGRSRLAVALLYTVAIASARKEVIIQNPYFAPDDGVCELLAKMVKRGVAVH